MISSCSLILTCGGHAALLVDCRQSGSDRWKRSPALQVSCMNAALKRGAHVLEFERRGVAQPGSAPALGADRPTPTAPFPTVASLCFQQLGASAFRSKLTPTIRIDRVLAQFWHSGLG